MNRKLDPEPITIIAAIAGVVSATVSATNYWRTHHKSLPHRIRAKLIVALDSLSAELRLLRKDVAQIKAIFQKAEFPSGRLLKLGNGAMVTYDQFRRYEALTDLTLGRLKKIHRLALRVEGLAFGLPHIDKAGPVNATGDALARADALLRSKDLSVDSAWVELQGIIDDLEHMIKQLKSDLGKGAAPGKPA